MYLVNLGELAERRRQSFGIVGTSDINHAYSDQPIVLAWRIRLISLLPMTRAAQAAKTIKVSIIHRSSKEKRDFVLDLAMSRKTTAITSKIRNTIEVKSNCLPSFPRGIIIGNAL